MLETLQKLWNRAASAPDARTATASTFAPSSGFTIRSEAAAQAILSQLRSAPRPEDQRLTLEADLWMLRLPAEVRPRELAERYPRLVNRLAAAWPSEGDTDAVFDDLLRDRRGDRQGFAPEVRRELRLLRHFSIRHRDRIDAHYAQHLRIRTGDTLTSLLPELDNAIDWIPTELVVDGRRSGPSDAQPASAGQSRAAAASNSAGSALATGTGHAES